MWCNKSTVGQFEKLPRSDRMLLLYLLDYNTKPRDWFQYPRPLQGSAVWRFFHRYHINLDPHTGRRANICT
jgi:hypothetical protein